MPKRRATARWDGSLTEGSGNMKMATGAYDGPYSFQSRFEEGTGTNPEELIAAAHAGCFSMALSGALGKAGATPESVETTAEVHLAKIEGGFAIQRIGLTTRVRASGIDEGAFQEAARDAKENCPVSRALGAVGEITVDATLES